MLLCTLLFLSTRATSTDELASPLLSAANSVSTSNDHFTTEDKESRIREIAEQLKASVLLISSVNPVSNAESQTEGTKSAMEHDPVPKNSTEDSEATSDESPTGSQIQPCTTRTSSSKRLCEYEESTAKKQKTYYDIRKHLNPRQLFDNFYKLLCDMRNRNDFKKELSNLIKDCYLDESQLKKELLDSILGKTKILNETKELFKHLFEDWTMSKIKPDSNFINFFIEILKEKPCPVFDSTIKIENTQKFNSDSKLGEYFKHLKCGISIIKESVKNEWRGNPSPKSKINSKRWKLLNKTTMCLVEDAMARLETDFKLRSHFCHLKSTERLFGSEVLKYLNSAIKIFKIFESNPNQNKKEFQATIKRIGGHKLYNLEFGRFQDTFRTNHARYDYLNGYRKFIVRMYARCRILHASFLVFRNFSSGVGYIKGVDLYVLILHSLLDYEKVKAFEEDYYKRIGKQ